MCMHAYATQTSWVPCMWIQTHRIFILTAASFCLSGNLVARRIFIQTAACSRRFDAYAMRLSELCINPTHHHQQHHIIYMITHRFLDRNLSRRYLIALHLPQHCK